MSHVSSAGGESPILLAAKLGDAEAVGMLCYVKGIDVNAQDGKGCTPLMCAVKSKHLETIKALLEVSR